MIVVSDASPLNVLIRSGHIEILPKLFVAVLAPPAVVREMSHPGTPTEVRTWVSNPPGWFTVQTPAADVSAELRHRGEREAIALAIESGADLLLVDDLKARRAARKAGLTLLGTIGVVERAARRGFLDLKEALSRLPAGFHLAQKLIDDALARDRDRRS